MSKDKSVDPQVAQAVTDELREIVLAKATDGSIPCAALRRVAEDNDVPYKVAGAAADMNGIKVRSCDLGCF